MSGAPSPCLINNPAHPSGITLTNAGSHPWRQKKRAASAILPISYSGAAVGQR